MQSQVVRSLHGFDHLGHRPFSTLLWMPMYLFRSKSIELSIVGRVYSDELSYKMRRQFCDCQSAAPSFEVITILL